MKSGLKPTPHDYRDYDLLKTKKLGGIPAFPENYCTDVGLWTPNQNADEQYFGCTNYTQTDLLIDEDRKLYNPMELENITHANANGGSDLRTSFQAVVKLHADHPTFFAVRPDIDRGGVIDWFDAMRVAMIIGKPENRAVSVGTPWFPEFSHPIEGIIYAFLNWALNRASWHNWAVKGWKTINGETYLICKPWLGNKYGDKGFSYFNRADFNRLMSINGTAAFTLDKLMPGEVPERVSSNVAQLLVSFFTNLFKSLGL